MLILSEIKMFNVSLFNHTRQRLHSKQVRSENFPVAPMLLLLVIALLVRYALFAYGVSHQKHVSKDSEGFDAGHKFDANPECILVYQVHQSL
jgi:hypothetical protein